ncbi:MAG: UDP-glucuronic acid decarboxylase family protein [Bacteroidales bacterium]|nr:UDP-glucuronic acid decarboxylase family protein [Bacteroidales bacterium]
MKKRILITGGAGFVGSHLCERLLNEGHEVISLITILQAPRKYIVHLMDNPYFELVRHDITQPFFIEVDEIYNLACPASPIHYQYNPIKTVKTSVMGAINMLGLAKRIKAKILQASTSEVYGDPEAIHTKEDYWGHVNPIGSRSCYDEGKRAAETLFMDYHLQNNVRIKIMRIFNTYGPRMHPSDGRVVSNFIVQALKGEDITIFGEGKQTRSFQYIDDLIDGATKFMATGNDFTGPVNIGNPYEFTIRELAEKVIQLTNTKSEIIFKPLPMDDPMQRKPDISLAREKLNWEPTIKLDEGLKKTIEYFEKLLKNSNNEFAHYRR